VTRSQKPMTFAKQAILEARGEDILSVSCHGRRSPLQIVCSCTAVNIDQIYHSAVRRSLQKPCFYTPLPWYSFCARATDFPPLTTHQILHHDCCPNDFNCRSEHALQPPFVGDGIYKPDRRPGLQGFDCLWECVPIDESLEGWCARSGAGYEFSGYQECFNQSQGGQVECRGPHGAVWECA